MLIIYIDWQLSHIVIPIGIHYKVNDQFLPNNREIKQIKWKKKKILSEQFQNPIEKS
jgi:hypothetical protein